MRKIEQEMCSKLVRDFYVPNDWSKSNTAVVQSDSGQLVYLHDHLIASINSMGRTMCDLVAVVLKPIPLSLG